MGWVLCFLVFCLFPFVNLKSRLLPSELESKSSAKFFSSLQFAICKSSYSNINLKAKQGKCLEAIYSGRDVAVLPTGYWKSIIFHLLPLLFYDKLNAGPQAPTPPVRPVIIVVSPLNALIKDQIRRSSKGNSSAAFLNAKRKKNSSELDLDASDSSYAMIKDAKYEIPFHTSRSRCVMQG